ncbi:uncharacterized protein LACBIDRAFT_329761 [Laccaria bicolor S238N-H82]|uniref:Predicted protein n=1 Tax=Laccaria bicolor (strain S238N-H82 / ATCC MYA-4686) TaxID=486041 RepID=B0DJ52_LACBS|nr:uncharacterized protein LACBIDRAFT_329761 [Laccaria bicolor S238N-H82]EDR05343.1 predicted protein [Laccaria bicolor S238N-H82]|eukprot:XP_001883901.1 predicted protein [Laccaria bicolor S238N-H82]
MEITRGLSFVIVVNVVCPYMSMGENGVSRERVKAIIAERSLCPKRQCPESSTERDVVQIFYPGATSVIDTCPRISKQLKCSLCSKHTFVGGDDPSSEERKENEGPNEGADDDVLSMT